MSALTRPLRLHLPLWLGLAVAVGAALLTPAEWRLPTRLATGWDAGVSLFLVLTLIKTLRIRSTDQIRARAAELDEAGAAVLPLSLLAAAASVAVVIGEAADARHSQAGTTAALVLTTLALSWTFVHLIFAQHYAHAFYGPGPDGGDRGGLLFPGEDEPDYWDFIHFALIIGVANQTADVQIADRRLRRIGSLHSLTAFVFNTVILALGVNFAVSLIGN